MQIVLLPNAYGTGSIQRIFVFRTHLKITLPTYLGNIFGIGVGEGIKEVEVEVRLFLSKIRL